MKNLLALTKEYIENENFFKESKNKYRDKNEEIKKTVKSHAKFKVGDKVIADIGWRNEDFNGGIIRQIVVLIPHGEKALLVGYKIGKVTKSGKIHKTQDIYYSAIEENKVRECAG